MSGTKTMVYAKPRPDGSMKIEGVEFSREELRAIENAAVAVWHEIGGDCIQATADEKGVSPEEIVIRKHVVVELVCDAGRLEQRLARNNKALAEKVRNLPGMAIYSAVRPAFPYSSYGL